MTAPSKALAAPISAARFAAYGAAGPGQTVSTRCSERGAVGQGGERHQIDD